MAKNEKGFSTFLPFSDPKVKKILDEKAAKEFPILTTAKGKCILHRLIKWVNVTYKSREMEIPVVGVTNNGEEREIELAKFFGKEKSFVVGRNTGNFKKDEKYEINALVTWDPELQSRTSLRNEAIMNAIEEDKEVTIVTVWGHYDEPNATSFNLTFVAEGATKL